VAQILRTDKGVVGGANLHQDACGIAFDDKAVTLGRSGQINYFDGQGWTETYTGLAPGSGEMICITSHGNIFASFTGSNKVYRSIDGGKAFSVCYTFPASTATTHAIAEDADGVLFMASYDTAPTGSADGGQLLKSMDGGASWSDITANLAMTYARHSHAVIYDHYRDALIVTGGDSTGQYMQYSTDGGNTWSIWNVLDQVTLVIPMRHGLVICSDHSSDRDLYFAETLGGPVVSVYHPDINTSVPANNGFVWHGEYDDDSGLVWVAYQEGDFYRVVASDDGGFNWQVLLDGQPGTDGVFARGRTYFTDRAKKHGVYSDPGIRFSAASDSGIKPYACYAYKVLPASFRGFRVDAVNGSDLGDGYSAPMKELLDSPDLAVVAPLIMESDWGEAAWFQSVVEIDGQGKYGFTGAAESATDRVTADFESGLSAPWTTGTIGSGTIDTASTTNPKTGTKCMRIVCPSGTSGAYIRNDMVSPDGKEYWGEADFYISALPTGGDYLSLMFTGGQSNCELRVRAGGRLEYYYYDTVNKAHGYLSAASPSGGAKTISAGTYVEVRMRLKVLDGGRGRVTVWLDNVLALDMIGVRTNDEANGKTPTQMRFGAKANYAVTVDIDNVVMQTEANPRMTLGGAVFKATGAVARGLKQHSQQVLMSSASGRLIGCVANNPTIGAPYKLAGANSEFVHGTLVGGTNGIVNVSGSAAVRNSIFVGQSGKAIVPNATPAVEGNIYYGTTYGVTPDATDQNIDPQLSDPGNGDFTPTAQEAINGGVKWWGTDPNPVGADGEPFCDWGPSVGAIQSKRHKFHPTNL